jgi:hypothetical protein
MEFCPRSHPDLRAPQHGERILPNTHSKNVARFPYIEIEKNYAEIELFCLKCVQPSRDLELGARDDDKRVRPCPPR